MRRFGILGFDQTFVGGPDVRFVPVPQAIDDVRKLNLVRRKSGSRICRSWSHGMEQAARRRQATRYARALRDAVVPAVPEGRFQRELRALVALAQLEQFPLPAETKRILRQVRAPEEPPCADVYH